MQKANRIPAIWRKSRHMVVAVSLVSHHWLVFLGILVWLSVTFIAEPKSEAESEPIAKSEAGMFHSFEEVWPLI